MGKKLIEHLTLANVLGGIVAVLITFSLYTTSDRIVAAQDTANAAMTKSVASELQNKNMEKYIASIAESATKMEESVDKLSIAVAVSEERHKSIVERIEKLER